MIVAAREKHLLILKFLKFLFLFIFSGYEDESVAIFEPFLKLLTQLSYNNMYSAVEASRNITQSEQYRRAMNKKTLRALMFQVLTNGKSFIHFQIITRLNFEMQLILGAESATKRE